MRAMNQILGREAVNLPLDSCVRFRHVTAYVHTDDILDYQLSLTLEIPGCPSVSSGHLRMTSTHFCLHLE